MKRVILLAIIFSTLILFTNNEIFASPSFPEQFIGGPTSAYYPDGHFEDDSYALNLEGAFYNSDSKTLYATLILHGKSGFEINNTLSYGILIDTDTDFGTGVGGFDFRYHVQWKNGTWFEIYEKIPTSGMPLENILEPRIIDTVFTPDVVINDRIKSTVKLKLDLEKIGSPDIYSVVFFTEGNLTGETPLVQDVLSRAVIPRLDFVVRTHPSPLSFESSTEQDAHIFIDSKFTENAVIYYNIRSNSKQVSIKEVFDNSIVLQGGKAEIPILLSDIGHDDIQVHELYVDLSPWYAVNPETRSVERGGEIFQSYHFRNQQYTDTFKILWTSLPQQPWDTILIVQVVLLVATSVMAGFGIWTHFDNRKFGNQERKINHSIDMAMIYKSMLSLICRQDYYTKQLQLRFPAEEINRTLLWEKRIDPDRDGTIILEVLTTDNLPHLGWALKHLKKYGDVYEKWKSLQELIHEYNDRSRLLKNEIRSACLKRIKENLRDFREYDGSYNPSYFIENIAFESYSILHDAVNGIPHPPPKNRTDPYDEEKKFLVTYADSTLFQSPKPYDSHSVNKILESSMDDVYRKEYQEMNNIFERSQHELQNFTNVLERLVTDLEGGDLIKGKCKIGI